MADPAPVAPTPTSIPTSPTPATPAPAPLAERSANAPQGASQPSWTSTITDAELLGHLQNHGWDRQTPAEAAIEAAKAHQNAQRMLGTPADRLIRLPARDDDEAGWRQVYQRLGAPEKADDYNFAGLEFKGRDGATDRFLTAIRQTAAEMNMPRVMAERMAQAFHKYTANEDAAIHTEQSAALQEEGRKLADDWGQPGSDRFRANEFIADQAMKALGVNQDAANKIRDGMGAADAARLFHKIGLAMGEDKYIAGNNPSRPDMMSREQAKARHNELMHDPEFRTRFLAGNPAEKREMAALDMLIANQGGGR